MRLVVKFYFYFCFNLFRSSSVFVRRVILHFFLQGTAFFFFSLYIVLTSWVIMVRASHWAASANVVCALNTAQFRASLLSAAILLCQFQILFHPCVWFALLVLFLFFYFLCFRKSSSFFCAVPFHWRHYHGNVWRVRKNEDRNQGQALPGAHSSLSLHIFHSTSSRGHFSWKDFHLLYLSLVLVQLLRHLCGSFSNSLLLLNLLLSRLSCQTAKTGGKRAHRRQRRQQIGRHDQKCTDGRSGWDSGTNGMNKMRRKW